MAPDSGTHSNLLRDGIVNIGAVPVRSVLVVVLGILHALVHTLQSHLAFAQIEAVRDFVEAGGCWYLDVTLPRHFEALTELDGCI
jgi:hypothetical protein